MIIEIRKHRKVGGSWFALVPKYVYDAFGNQEFSLVYALPYTDEPVGMFNIIMCRTVDIPKLQYKKLLIVNEDKIKYNVNVKEEDLTKLNMKIAKAERCVVPDVVNIKTPVEFESKQPTAPQQDDDKITTNYDIEI